MHSDRANLTDDGERRKLAKRMAAELGVDEGGLLEQLEQVWNETLDQRRRYQEQAAAGSAEAAAIATMQLLDEAPPTIRRPLYLIGGRAYAAAWVPVLFLNLKWIQSVLNGPVPIQIADLRRLEDPKTLPNQWVSFTFDKAIDTGVGIESRRGGTSTPRSRLLLVQVQDRWLIAEVPVKHEGNQITGYLDTWSAPLRREMIEAVTAKHPQLPVLPFQIDAEHSQRGQCFAMLGVMGFFLVGGLVMAAVGLVNWRRLAREGY